MRAESFLDTGVLLYAVAGDDQRSSAAVAALADAGITNVQVLSEFTLIARRSLKRSWAEVHEALSIFTVLCPKPRPIHLSTYEVAIELVQQEGLGLPDAMIASSALLAGCTRLLTSMAADGRVIGDRLRVCNPFGPALVHHRLKVPAGTSVAVSKPDAGTGRQAQSGRGS